MDTDSIAAREHKARKDFPPSPPRYPSPHRMGRR